MSARTLAIHLARPYAGVYAFLAEPRNFAKWASGLGNGLKPDGGHWWVDAPQGRAKVVFTPANDYGVLDHRVELPGGETTIYVPMRLIDVGDGCELLLTVLRQPELDDEQFTADCDWVRRDLQALKRLIER